MKRHIIFELDADPATTEGEIVALVRLAGEAFTRGIAPIGQCRLVQIKRVSGEMPKHVRHDRPRE